MSEQTRLTKNGLPLEQFRGIQEQFFILALGKEEPEMAITMSPDLFNDVSGFCETLRTAMSQEFDGSAEAVDTFKAAMKTRSALLGDPRVSRNGDLRDMLKFVVAQDGRGNPEKSLDLTRQLHADGLNPFYAGEERPKEAEMAAEGAMPLFE